MTTSAEVIASSNITKKLRMLQLNQHIIRIIVATHDRIFFKANVGMITRLNMLVDTDEMKLSPLSGGPHDMIFKLGPCSSLKKRKSYRENKRPSLQVVAGIGSDSFCYGDADIDLGSPSMDIVSFITHMAELVTPGPTNHRQLQKKIDKQFKAWEEMNA